MKLVTYDDGSGPRAGVLVDDSVFDASALLSSPVPLRDVQAVLEQTDSPVERLNEGLAANFGPGVRLNSVRLLAPILRPPTVRDFIAFEEHATAQFQYQAPEVWKRLPLFYFSNPLRILGPEATVDFPAATQRLDYECEIGAVIGRQGSNVLAADAAPYIAGFTIFNDWSCRDIQSDEQSFGLGPAKGKDSASSIGPYVVTTDELEPYFHDGRLDVRCQVRVNGEQWMDNRASGMFHTFFDIVERASQDSLVVPGDVIGGGTIGGGSIAEGIRKGFPARYLQPGDVVEVEIEGLGILKNTIGPITNPNRNVRFKPPGVPAMPQPLPKGHPMRRESQRSS